MNPDFKKSADGLLPVIIQDAQTRVVLMLGYMNAEAFEKTKAKKRVCFYSRSKQRLWTKGEESGNFMDVIDIKEDCDKDTLLIAVKPWGPVCHNGTDTCFAEKNTDANFLNALEAIIQNRKNNPLETSYTSSLFASGINKIAQKVGEEAVELVIEAIDHDDDKFKNEAADLLFHYLILLAQKGFSMNDINKILEERNKPKTAHS